MTYNTAEVWDQIEENGKAVCDHSAPVAFRAQLLKESAEYGVSINISTYRARDKYPRLYVYLTGAR
jgi:hypothetical protein